MDVFPAFLPLAGARVVVAGHGEAADAKARLFDGSPAQVLRLDTPEVVTAEACAGARLVFIASDDPEASAAAGARAREAGALVNVVDRPALSDFATPSIVDRGAVVGAVGTGGAAPVLAVRLRQELETLWPARLGELARLLQRLRLLAGARLATMDARRRFYTQVLDGEAGRLALAGDAEAAWAAAVALLATEGAVGPGRATVIAIPAEPDLLNLRAVRRLGAAERLFVEPGIAAEVLAHARRDAPRAAPEAQAISDALARGEAFAVLATDAAGWVRRLEASGVDVERIG